MEDREFQIGKFDEYYDRSKNQTFFSEPKFNALYHITQLDPTHPYLYHYTPWNCILVKLNNSKKYINKSYQQIFVLPARIVFYKNWPEDHKVGAQIAIQFYKTRCNSPRIDIICYDTQFPAIYIHKTFVPSMAILDYDYKVDSATRAQIMT
jgi:hypothetical protein